MKQPTPPGLVDLEKGERKHGAHPRLEDSEKGEYILVTAHRAENVDEKDKLAGILKGLEAIQRETGLPIIFPIHPRTEKMMNHFNLKATSITFTKPLGYLEFLSLESNARLVITDSGGLQEEACILGVPCVTLRENTERPETIDVGSNVLAGTDAHTILDKSRIMPDKTPVWKNPYGDGHAGRRMVERLHEGPLKNRPVFRIDSLNFNASGAIRGKISREDSPNRLMRYFQCLLFALRRHELRRLQEAGILPRGPGIHQIGGPE